MLLFWQFLSIQTHFGGEEEDHEAPTLTMSEKIKRKLDDIKVCWLNFVIVFLKVRSSSRCWASAEIALVETMSTFVCLCQLMHNDTRVWTHLYKVRKYLPLEIKQIQLKGLLHDSGHSLDLILQYFFLTVSEK